MTEAINGGHKLRILCLVAACVFVAKPGAWGQGARDWFPTIQWSNQEPVPVPCPNDTAKSQLIKDADRGLTQAQSRLGRLKLSACKGMHDPADGMKLLQRAAAKGDVQAQLALANGYRTAELGQADPFRALFWYKKAALMDDQRARNNWAVALYFGSGTERNQSAAAKLFHISAQQGLTEAQYNLAALYDLGEGVTQSYRDARQWYLKAADDEDGAAEYRLGMLCELGLGGDRNQDTAMHWYKKAQDDGSAAAMLRLGPESSTDPDELQFNLYTAGMALLYGNGVAQDTGKGVALLEKAANRHYAEAQFELGVVYANGRGVKKNEAKAIEYYEAFIAAQNVSGKERAPAEERSLASAYNNIAWVRVTSTDPKIRNQQKALDYARKGVDLTEGREANILDTLATAYFQAGETDKAIETETKALALQPQSRTYAATLARFRRGR